MRPACPYKTTTCLMHRFFRSSGGSHCCLQQRVPGSSWGLRPPSGTSSSGPRHCWPRPSCARVALPLDSRAPAAQSLRQLLPQRLWRQHPPGRLLPALCNHPLTAKKRRRGAARGAGALVAAAALEDEHDASPGLPAFPACCRGCVRRSPLQKPRGASQAVLAASGSCGIAHLASALLLPFVILLMMKQQGLFSSLGPRRRAVP